jgi:ABC-type Fe3+-hydroxamate transport system substrate-binding protein
MIRVVSLVPSVTETLLAWGIEPVACTRFCEQPSLQHVGGTKDPDVVAIAALAPDLVVVDREENRREDADALEAAGATLHVTHVTSVADVGPTLAALAAAVGMAAAASNVDPLSGAPARSPSGRRRAFVPIWRRPWMTLNADTYGSSVLAAIGVDNVFADHVDRYPTVQLDEVAPGVDLVVLPSEPYPFAERHLTEVSGITGDVRLVDGRDLFWWGVRTEGALARLAQALS